MRVLREWMLRVLGTLRRGRSDADLQEELRLHMELAAEAAQRRGEPVRAARMHTGGTTQAMEAIRDQRGWPWLQSVFADVVFAARQLNKHRTATAAAILSLGLAVGATTTAFRLVNAVLWRTLPVAEPERLFVIAWNAVTSQSDAEYRDELDYITFQRYSEVVGDRAELMVIGMTGRPQAIEFEGAGVTERATRQHVSGNVFSSFGLQPALGRLLTRADDITPGGHPVAIISHRFWTRRFAQDPGVLGKTFRLGQQSFEIVGVGPRGFTGTEPGRLTDIFIPATMNVPALDSPGWSWFRAWVQPRRDVSVHQVRQLLQGEFAREHQERSKAFPADTPKERLAAYLGEQLMLEPAGAGTSAPQRNLRRPLLILSALVVLVLFVACANLANLLAAQAVSRTREMALRVSIGAGRWRLIQLVLVESVLLAICASIAGILFAWWAAPFVVSLVDLGVPLELVLEADWRTIAFGVAVTITVTALFGLAPAIRAAAVDPLAGLKERVDGYSHRRLTRALVAAQMTFCVFVLFVAGLLVATFSNLTNRPLGFDYERVLLVDAQSEQGGRVDSVWSELTERLRTVPSVESVALANWVPLSQNRWTSVVRVPGQSNVQIPALVLSVSPDYFETMRVGMVGGRDFHASDVAPRVDQNKQTIAGVGIVNEALARALFNGENPVGKTATLSDNNGYPPFEIVGLVRDSAYYEVREPMRPIVYLPISAGVRPTAQGREVGTFVVRTTGDPLVAVPAIRVQLSQVRTDFRTEVAPYRTMVGRQMVFERLLAILSGFFAVVALLLVGIGLYGVLNYAVIQRRREIGVRMALGARAAHVVRRVTNEMLGPIGVGCLLGLAGGLAFGRLIERILFEVTATDPSTIATPLLALAVAAALAALPPAVRAVRIDPAQTLRSE
jgi:predicted permease